MYKYIYENKKTGKKLYTNHKLDKEGFKLMRQTKNGKIKSSGVIKKGAKTNASNSRNRRS